MWLFWSSVVNTTLVKSASSKITDSCYERLPHRASKEDEEQRKFQFKGLLLSNFIFTSIQQIFQSLFVYAIRQGQRATDKYTMDSDTSFQTYCARYGSNTVYLIKAFK